MQRKMYIKLLFLLFALGSWSLLNAQTTPAASAETEKAGDEGIAVTPSSVRLFLKPGESVIKEIKVTNKTKKAYTFSVAFNDFDMNENGKPQGPASSKYALSKWAVASPSYFEIQPGQVQKIQLTISVPADEAGQVAAWTIMSIDQVIKRDPIASADNSAKAVALGVIPSFGFGIYVYQNPPDAGVPEIEIQKFEKKLDERNKEERLYMHVKCSGKAIGFCKTYAELTNTATGEMVKIPPRTFTILPGFERSLFFTLPKNMPKGKYSVMAVVDYGSKDDMKAAELDLTIE